MNDKNQEYVCNVLAQYHANGGALQSDDLVLLDLTALRCPEPLMLLRQAMRQARESTFLLVLATDPSTQRDFQSYCRFTQHKLVFETHLPLPEPLFAYIIQKKPS